MKSIWLWTCPLSECQVVVKDSLWGCIVMAKLTWWLLAISSSLRRLSFVSPTVLAQFLYVPGLTLAFWSPIFLELGLSWGLFMLLIKVWSLALTWMMVMLCVLADILMMILLKTEVQLMALPAISYLAMNATLYWYFFSSPENQILWLYSDVSLMPIYQTRQPNDIPAVASRFVSSWILLEA